MQRCGQVVVGEALHGGFSVFGLSKKERLAKAVGVLLQTQYYLTRLQAEALADELIGHVKGHVQLPEQAALPIAAVGAKMLYDAGHLDRAEQLNRRVRIVGAELLRQGKIHNGQWADLLSHLPGLEQAEGEALDLCPSGAAPSRVHCVRAGWAFTVYWQLYDARSEVRSMASTAEDDSLTRPLLQVFAHSRKNLDWVSAKYRQGRGSNDVLRQALGGAPDHALYWFRIGQVVNALLDSGIDPDDKQYALGEMAVRSNTSQGGVSQADGDRLLGLARQVRECHRRQDAHADLMDWVGRLQGCLIEIAAKHDNLEEFEQKAKAHGGAFISYAHADAVIAKALAGRLTKEEIAVWLDENEVTPGNHVATTLADGVAHSCVFLLLVSPESLKSPWVSFEVDRALERAQSAGQVLIPLLTSGVTHRDVPEKLQSIVSFPLGNSPHESFPRVLDAVREHLVSAELRRRSHAREGAGAAWT